MPLSALWAGYCSFIRLIDKFSMFAIRIAAATDKHTKPPLAEYQHRAAGRTRLPLQNFDNMSVRLAFQGADIVTVRIMRAAEKRPVLPGAYYQFSPTLRAGFVFTHRKQRCFGHNNSNVAAKKLVQHTFIYFKE